MIKKKSLKEVVTFLAEQLIDDESTLEVKEISSDSNTVLEIKLPKNEAGKLIGKGGKTADAIRTILYCIAAREKKRCTLQINE